MMKKLILLSVISLITLSLQAQDLEKWVQENPNSMPHWLTADEAERLDEIGRGFVVTDPPSGEVRQTAEFEPMEGVLVRYQFGIPMQLVAEISEDVIVYTLVQNLSQENTVRSMYSSNGVTMENCEFIYAPTDSYWVRDYGPWFIIEDNTIPGIVDFPYNRPRPNDNNVPSVAASSLDVNLYGMDLIQTGGNYMTDGMGVGASTDLVWEENPTLSQAEVDALVEDYLGIHTYHVMPDPLDDYIKHIDCWGKFLDVDKVLIGQVPTSDYRYQDFEETAQYFENSTSSYGTPYQVYRVYTPGDYPYTPYTNSLIVNENVFVPLTGGPHDAAALQTYEEAMPGYEIHGIVYDGWLNTDALHCRTRGVIDRGMLSIRHLPLLGEQPQLDFYPIEVEIYNLSNEDLYADSLWVKYQVNEGGYTEIPLVSKSKNVYTAEIPAQTAGSQVDYYIHAADMSGRSEHHPYVGPHDPHTFTIGTFAPELTLSDENFVQEAMQGETLTDLLTLTNSGTGLLSFDLSIENSSSVQWLSLSAESGEINTGESTDVTLTYTTNELTTGEYTANVLVIDNLKKEITTVPVTLNVLPLTSVASIETSAQLYEPYPNPLNTATYIAFDLEKSSPVSLSVYNMNGQLVKQLVNRDLAAGTYRIQWQANNEQGEAMPEGVYFVRFQTSDYQDVKRLILLK